MFEPIADGVPALLQALPAHAPSLEARNILSHGHPPLEDLHFGLAKWRAVTLRAASHARRSGYA
jgi:hypothetical protein